MYCCTDIMYDVLCVAVLSCFNKKINEIKIKKSLRVAVTLHARSTDADIKKTRKFNYSRTAPLIASRGECNVHPFLLTA